jgi:hypothetical protein
VAAAAYVLSYVLGVIAALPGRLPSFYCTYRIYTYVHGAMCMDIHSSTHAHTYIRNNTHTHVDTQLTEGLREENLSTIALAALTGLGFRV